MIAGAEGYRQEHRVSPQEVAPSGSGQLSPDRPALFPSTRWSPVLEARPPPPGVPSGALAALAELPGQDAAPEKQDDEAFRDRQAEAIAGLGWPPFLPSLIT